MEEKKQNGKNDSPTSGVTATTNGAIGFTGEKELYTKVPFPGKLLILGCGSIGQCILPMLLRHTDITPEGMQIGAGDHGGEHGAAQFGI